jgi:hypothetical protein
MKVQKLSEQFSTGDGVCEFLGTDSVCSVLNGQRSS